MQIIQKQTSAAMREYLAEIYRLQEDSPTVSTTSLAERLEVSAPAVPRMLRRLKTAGLVKHVPYQGVELTELGTEEALREIRRHRVLEVFLVNVMGFSWSETHEHADDLTPGLNDTIVQRMADMTDNPQRCPHGQPIPDAEGVMPIVEDTCITNLAIGYKGKISRIRTHDLEMLDYFMSISLIPDTLFEIVGRAPFNGPIRLRVGREEIVVGATLAQAIWVSEL